MGAGFVMARTRRTRPVPTAWLFLALALTSCASAQFYVKPVRQSGTQQEGSPKPDTQQNRTQQASTTPLSSPQPAPAAGEQQTTPASSSEAMLAVAKATNDFGRELYEALRSEPGNLLVSPLSAAAVLALAWLGAGGRTVQQLAAALHLAPDAQLATAGYSELLRTLQQGDARVRLDVASRAFLRRGLGLKEDFARAAALALGAGAEEVDFARPAGAAAAVNGWARNATRGKIDELVQPGALSAATALVLANAVYFKGSWRTQFDPELTLIKPFRTAGAQEAGRARNVSLMWTSDVFPFALLRPLAAQAVRLPYAGGRVSMLVLLPSAVDGLPALEAAMATVDLHSLLGALRRDEVQVALPRFSMRSSLPLNDALVKLGLSDLFGSSADFSRLSERGAFLSRVQQKAVIDVNEEGTEAAAATGGVVLLSAGHHNIFKADHPFLFYILHDQTETVLFQGRFSEPE